MSVVIYVEGGGDQRALLAECRRGFAEFFRKIVPPGHQPKIVACGGRNATFDRFCTALKQNKEAAVLLLVDAEALVSKAPWQHLEARDGWQQPPGAAEGNAHLMVQCMEAWFLADREVLAAYYRQGFRTNALPGQADIEKIAKSDLFKALDAATRDSKTKGRYGKGRHSFELLALIRPEKVRTASIHAARLFKVVVASASVRGGLSSW